MWNRLAKERDRLARAAPFLPAFYLALVAIFLLYPFNFSSPYTTAENSVRWLDEAKGVAFGPSPGMLVSAGPPQHLFDALQAAGGLTVEMWLTSALSDNDDLARIISYSLNPWERNFTVGQEGRDLVLRLRTTEGNANGTPEVGAPDAIEPGRTQHVAITYDSSTVRIFVDGRLIEEAERQGSFENWDPSGLLVFGNEASGGRPWAGSISYAAIYGRALVPATIAARHAAGSTERPTAAPEGLLVSYDFRNGPPPAVSRPAGALPMPALEAPAQIPTTSRLFFLWIDGKMLLMVTSVWDLFRNVVLFVPFGVFGLILTRRRRLPVDGMTLVVAVAALVSTSCETLQFFLEGRTSSVLDVATNTAGALIGAVGYRYYWPRWLRAIHIRQRRNKQAQKPSAPC